MPSAPESFLEPLYHQINLLSDEAKHAARHGEYESSDVILTQRLTLLKKLSEKAQDFEQNPVLFQTYQTFLHKLKKSDDEEVSLLTQERLTVIAENAEQQKRTKAVNIYHQVSLDK